MYRCIPPTPSWLWGTWSIILGMKPATSVPVVSVMYFPTVPLPFARPFGNAADFELRSRREVSSGLVDQEVVAAGGGRRLEYAGRLVGEIVFAGEEADQAVDLVEKGGHVLVGDGRVVTQASPGLRLGVVGAEPERDPAPVGGAAP